MDDPPLRIGLAAPLWYPVGPDRGGVEQIVFLLARELDAAGHQVTLIASGGSTGAGRLVPVTPESVTTMMQKGQADEYRLYEAAAAGRALEQARHLDVLHSHLGTRLVPLAGLTATPVVHTLHTSISQDMRWLLRQFPHAHLTTVSRWQAAALDDASATDVIRNGVDLAAFPVSTTADDYLLVLGRIEAAKGTDVAIDVAREAGRRLVIAGHVADSAFFDARIRPRLDGDRVRWAGPVGGTEKVALLQRARGLLFPVQWEEAFGLVMVEAMACGTPVVALTRGAVPEIVVPGENGFHTPHVAELPALARRIAGLDRTRVRASVERRFSHLRMVAEYLRLYRRLVAEAAARG